MFGQMQQAAEGAVDATSGHVAHLRGSVDANLATQRSAQGGLFAPGGGAGLPVLPAGTFPPAPPGAPAPPPPAPAPPHAPPAAPAPPSAAPPPAATSQEMVPLLASQEPQLPPMPQMPPALMLQQQAMQQAAGGMMGLGGSMPQMPWGASNPSARMEPYQIFQLYADEERGGLTYTGFCAMLNHLKVRLESLMRWVGRRWFR